jgi:hypothetical protein
MKYWIVISAGLVLEYKAETKPFAIMKYINEYGFSRGRPNSDDCIEVHILERQRLLDDVAAKAGLPVFDEHHNGGACAVGDKRYDNHIDLMKDFGLKVGNYITQK